VPAGLLGVARIVAPSAPVFLAHVLLALSAVTLLEELLTVFDLEVHGVAFVATRSDHDLLIGVGEAARR
jgi:hypothetical protein